MVLFSNLPRVRGDQPIEYASLTEETFTPHARGSTRLCRRRKRPPKILPACAGINPIRYASGSQSIDLPRMRGDQPQPIVAYTTFKDLPRVCGDQPGYTFVLDYWCEFPPRARGSTLVIALSADVVYIYPACAGISLGKAQLLSRYFNLPRRRGDHPFVPKRRKIANNLPRMRGDQPRVTVMVASFSAFPPRARGSTHADPRRWFCSQIYPACAGINLGYADESGPRQHLPRMRGDQPPRLVLRHFY